ncbi:hypothetical protein [Desulfocurvus vexinensis]|uniref:hypothetical protein n=1 Tax=Desulfocurvus vexinensis TaxID=399548 RepID=UPI0004910E5F|nr:hypothetical protein [Desulfocurvus vexinensis]
MADPGLLVKGLCSTAMARIDHARKHLALAEADILTVSDGQGLDARLSAIRSACEHVDIATSDLEGAKLVLES